MGEKLDNGNSKDDSVAQAWADAMSTFTERTGLELPDYSPTPESTGTTDPDNDWDDDWSDDWDDGWGIYDEPQDIKTQPKSKLDKYQVDWGEDPTLAQKEFERLRSLKSEAKLITEGAARKIESRRRGVKYTIDKYCDPKRFSPEQLETIYGYFDSYIIGKENNDYSYTLEHADEWAEDGQTVIEILEHKKELAALPETQSIFSDRSNEALEHYHHAHGLDHNRLEAFKQNIEPLIESEDKEVASLLMNTNNWAVLKGAFGVADYTVHCLTQRINPSNLNELLMARREMPTTDQYRLEQNRIDALELQGTLYRARDFIHDETPGTHQILSAMLEYYDSRNDPELHNAKRQALEDAVSGRDQWARDNNYFAADSNNFSSYVFDLENYEKPVHLRGLERNSSSGRIGSDILEKTEPAVDCLRRLVENTNPDHLVPPETKYPKLNELLQNLRINQNEQTGETHVDWHQAGKLIESVNQILIDRQRKDGLYPSMVEATAFTERIATFALRDITRRDWRELPYDPNFKEIVRFSQLTYSDKPYDARKLERFWNGFSDITNGDLSDENLQAAYNKLQRLILGNLSGLADKYSGNPNTTKYTEALWSGNLIRELIALADPNASRK